MPYSTLDSIFRRGIQNASITNVIKICKKLQISTDHLCNGKIVPISTNDASGCCNYQTIFDDSIPPTDSELELLRKYRRLSPIHRSAIDNLIEQLYPVDSGGKCVDVSGAG